MSRRGSGGYDALKAAMLDEHGDDLDSLSQENVPLGAMHAVVAMKRGRALGLRRQSVSIMEPKNDQRTQCHALFKI